MVGCAGAPPGLLQFTGAFGGTLLSLCVCFPFCEWKWYLCNSVGGGVDLGDVSAMPLNAKNTVFTSLFRYICRPRLQGETTQC